MSDSSQQACARVLPWQQSQWEDWLRQLEAGRLPHALLISGLPGLGKQRLARAFVQALLCQAELHSRPCGRCKGCQLVAAESHPDLRLLEPAESGKAIKIDQVRELMDFLSGTAQQGGWKCAVVDPAEAMNINAANALLKSLEEPPGDSVILLVSSTPARLLPTLRSRCRPVKLSPPPRPEALAWLETRVGNAAAALLDLAHGAPLRALKANEEGRLALRNELLELLLRVAQGQSSPLEAAAGLYKSDDNEALDQLLDLLISLARQRWTTAAESLAEEWSAVIGRTDPRQVFLFADKLLQAKAQLLSSANPNKQLLWEELMLDWRALTAAPVGRRPAAVGR